MSINHHSEVEQRDYEILCGAEWSFFLFSKPTSYDNKCDKPRFGVTEEAGRDRVRWRQRRNSAEENEIASFFFIWSEMDDSHINAVLNTFTKCFTVFLKALR